MAARKRQPTANPGVGPIAGVGVDYYGGQVIDPSENVKSLSEAANLRQDDLRAAQDRLLEVRITHLKELINLQAVHQKQLDQAESDRLNSIRQVDREEVTKTAASAQTAIATLANTTTTMAETLRNQVANTAAAAEARQQTYASEINKRLSALELGSSEGKGRSGVADPMMAEAVAKMERIAEAMAKGTGQSQGQKNIVTYISVGISILLGLLLLMDRLK